MLYTFDGQEVDDNFLSNKPKYRGSDGLLFNFQGKLIKQMRSNFSNPDAAHITAQLWYYRQAFQRLACPEKVLFYPDGSYFGFVRSEITALPLSSIDDFSLKKLNFEFKKLWHDFQLLNKLGIIAYDSNHFENILINSVEELALIDTEQFGYAGPNNPEKENRKKFNSLVLSVLAKEECDYFQDDNLLEYLESQADQTIPATEMYEKILKR